MDEELYPLDADALLFRKNQHSTLRAPTQGVSLFADRELFSFLGRGGNLLPHIFLKQFVKPKEKT